MALYGTSRTASIYARVGGAWVASGESWICRLQPLSPTTNLQNEQFAETTHRVIGDPTPIIITGYKLVIDGASYFVNGAQMHDRPGFGSHHQECWLTKADT